MTSQLSSRRQHCVICEKVGLLRTEAHIHGPRTPLQHAIAGNQLQLHSPARFEVINVNEDLRNRLNNSNQLFNWSKTSRMSARYVMDAGCGYVNWPLPLKQLQQHHTDCEAVLSAQHSIILRRQLDAVHIHQLLRSLTIPAHPADALAPRATFGVSHQLGHCCIH